MSLSVKYVSDMTAEEISNFISKNCVTKNQLNQVIFRLKKENKIRLMSCTCVGRLSPYAALLNAVKEAKELDCDYESIMDIPSEILTKHGIFKTPGVLEYDVVDEMSNMYEKYGIRPARCRDCEFEDDGICGYYCGTTTYEEKICDSFYSEDPKAIVLFVGGIRYVIGYYIIDESKIKTGKDAIDKLLLSGQENEIIRECEKFSSEISSMYTMETVERERLIPISSWEQTGFLPYELEEYFEKIKHKGVMGWD